MSSTVTRWRWLRVNAVFLLCLLGPVGRGTAGQVLIGNTFLGGGAEEGGQGIAVDGSGNVYVTGYSFTSWGNPVRAYTEDRDVFVAKLNRSGTLLWNTFLGGSSRDHGYGIAVDGSGNVYVTGWSLASWGSPVRAYTGTYDAFVAKLDNNGNLVWNTFLGGSGTDEGHGLALDGSNNVYVTGYSFASWGSPVRAYTPTFGDGFAAKLDSSGALVWNTFLGGSNNDYGQGIAVDGSFNVYVAGYSYASWGSPLRAYTAAGDGFATKLDIGGALVWHTFLGGSGGDRAFDIAVNDSSNVYVTGDSSASWGSPARAFSGSYAAFAVALDSAGNLAWNTFLGGDGENSGNGIAVDADGNVHVAGASGSAWGDPVRAYSGNDDAFVAKLDGAGDLLSNTFLGGGGDDSAFGIASGADGSVYVVGSSDAAWDDPVRAHAGSRDAFVAKLGAGGVMYPSGGIEMDERRPEFSWPDTEGATWYQLWISLEGAKWQAPWVQGATTWTPAADMPPGNYSWWVRPWNAATGYGDWSEAATFSIAFSRPTAAPPQIGPSGDVTDTRRPTFEWTAVARATWYRLYVSRDGNAVIDRWVTAETLEFTPDVDLAAGTYRWWVVGWGPDGFGPWSGAATFVIEARTPGAIVQLAPQGEQTENNLTYRWEKDIHATWYRMVVTQTGAGTWHDRWYNLPPNGLEAEVPLAGHPAGAFTWWIRPWGPDGYGPWSGPMAFSSPGPDPAKPELIVPTGTITATQPTFEWHPAARATWYRVYVQRGTTKIVDQWTQDAQLPCPTVLSLGDYAWWVSAWNDVTKKTVWSDRMDFTLADAPPVLDGMVLIPGGTNVGTNPLAASVDGYNNMYTEEAVYRTNRSDTVVQGAAAGYRLPTDAEWEYAARSGLNSRRFPWGDTIQHTQANYYSHDFLSYDISSTRGFHPDSGTSPRTVAVGSFAANGYGLFDMAGNVYEWCFDWHPSLVGEQRIHRGGGHDYYATACRVGTRAYMWPDIASGAIGFRTVRSPDP